MKQSYQITGMTCQSCVAHVKEALAALPGVQQVQVSLADQRADFLLSSSLEPSAVQLALGEQYRAESIPRINLSQTAPIREAEDTDAIPSPGTSNWNQLYPLGLVFAFLIGSIGWMHLQADSWDGWQMMRDMMGGFFVVFSFFKFLDLAGFSQAFATYDPLAKGWPAYGHLYPFAELALGLAFLSNWESKLLPLMTILLLGISTFGVIQTLRNKRVIQCACLGTIFNLPMTQVTLLENSLMISMAFIMIGVG